MYAFENRKRWFYFFSAAVAYFLSTDYLGLILSGDDGFLRKVALGLWLLLSVVWTLLFIRNLALERRRGKKPISRRPFE